MRLFVCTQVFAYLDRWNKVHKFDGDGKKILPVYLIFVVDGRIDPYKISRNYGHDLKKKKVDSLRRRLIAKWKKEGSVPDSDDLRR